MKFECENPKEVAHEMLWLAWQACGGPVGMGLLQDRPNVTKKDVVQNVASSGDYPGNASGNSEIKLYADYVFGRMMKLRIDIKEDRIEIMNDKVDSAYNGWHREFPTYKKLIGRAVANLEKS